jgi:DNA-binding NarL/FixJ family response regulator
VALAASELDVAKAAEMELVQLAALYSSPGMSAAAAQAIGLVANAEGRHNDALSALRDAIRRWTELVVPYEVARCRVAKAEVLGALGDHDGAALELTAAREVFQELGATTDFEAIAQSGRSFPGRLTAREAEVLSCVAAGQSNREVAATLFIAEKTVARHLSNIFTKLGATSRTEAAAFAHEHGLVTHRRA